MSTRVRKRVRGRSGQRGTGLRRDVQEAIDRIWPDGIVEMSRGRDASYLSVQTRGALYRLDSYHMPGSRSVVSSGVHGTREELPP